MIGIWGWNEVILPLISKWVKIHVNAAGDVQVDVKTSNLPTGAATLAKQTTIIGHIDGIEALLAGGLPAELGYRGGLKVVNLFHGQVYVNSDTATTNDARRFEAAEFRLRDAVIIVKDYDQLFGDAIGQTYPVAAGETIGFTKVDLSTLFFRNATDDEDGTVHILGVEE